MSVDVNDSDYEIYVDGSFLNGSVGYGVIILMDGELVEELSGSVPDDFVQGARNIAGELFAIEKAIEWCQSNSVKSVSIYYDCEGIEKWATGKWKTKRPITQRYAELVRESGLLIRWHKVESHTGDLWNEKADELAKKGADPTLQSVPSGEPDVDLESKANGFAQFLRDHGYKTELKGIYSSNCAKIGISDADKDIGYVNIYSTKKEPFLPRYHELKDKNYEDKLNSLWQEYHYGERQLPLGF